MADENNVEATEEATPTTEAPTDAQSTDAPKEAADEQKKD